MTSIALIFFYFTAYFIAPGSLTDTTRFEYGPGHRMRDFAYVDTCTGSGSQPSCAHKGSSTVYIGNLPLLADAIGTGSSTVTSTGPTGVAGTQYSAICIPNPFRKQGTGTGTNFFNTGSGVVMRLVYSNVKNPAAASGDIGFVQSCNSGTGDTLLANLSTVTGATVSFVPTATNGNWNGWDFIKLGMSTDPTPSFRARLYIEALGVGEK